MSAITPATLLALLCAIPVAADDQLGDLLGRFYRATAPSDQAAARKAILATKDLTPAKLAAAIRSVQLWEPQQTGEYEASIRLRKGKASEMQVWLQVPEGYDPGKAWPLVIALHGHDGKAQQMLRLTRQILDDRAKDFIIAAPQDLGPLGFTMPADVVARPRNLLVALRRTFHIDSDRVFIVGYSQGSHDAWISAVMHGDCFAGIVPLAAPLQLVGNDLLYEELLPNVRHVGVLFCWGANDNLDADGKLDPAGGNAAACRKMRQVIGKLEYDSFKGVELESVGHINVAPPKDLLSDLLNRRRARCPKRVRQVFRLPDQSDAYWIGAANFEGAPLPDGPLSIPVPADEDPIVAQRKWLTDRLGLLDAECKKQTIKMAARRVVDVVLLLDDELLDLDKPVKITRGTRTAFEGKVERDMKVMLTESARTWDFGRLPTARVVVPRTGKVKFGYAKAAKPQAKAAKRSAPSAGE
jgi:poly(3-hydroxybutyrate) depolymerase